MIEIKNLTKKFKNKIAVNDASLEIKNGKITGIIGPNGCGKTTLINCLLDIYKYDGSITYDKTDLINKLFAYVPDELLLPNKLTGKEYTQFILSLYGIKDSNKLDKLLLLYDMKNCFNNLIDTYSFGMKKKLQLICAFSLNCPYIVLDEPFRGLDIESILITKKLITMFIGLGLGIFISSHELYSMETMCDSVIIMSEGKVLMQGKPKDLFKEYEVDSLEVLFVEKAVSVTRRELIDEIITDF